jgi:LPS-assembly lipoprotein
LAPRFSIVFQGLQPTALCFKLSRMNRSRLSAILAIVSLSLFLSACGFHLRGKIALPADTPPIRVNSATRYSELVTILERGLQNAGATMAGEDMPNDEVARLEVLSERWGDLPIAVDERGRAQEYSLRYAVIFAFYRPDGGELVPQQTVELARDYVSPPVDATGTSTEREILADELRKEMSASILRRIDSVVRFNPDLTGPPPQNPPSPLLDP